MSNKTPQSILDYAKRAMGVDETTETNDDLATELYKLIENGYQIILKHVEQEEGDAVIEAIHQLTSYMSEEQTFNYKCKVVTDTLLQLYE